VAVIALSLTVFATACGDRTGTGVDLAPFRQMAREAPCADISNRLFLIDGELVFWQREGNCADAAYAYTLYGTTPDQILCTLYQTIAGPVDKCEDADYRGLFDTVVSNLGSPDLGLGAEHGVDPVSF
jgi:hypothetical protein